MKPDPEEMQELAAKADESVEFESEVARLSEGIIKIQELLGEGVTDWEKYARKAEYDRGGALLYAKTVLALKDCEELQ